MPTQQNFVELSIVIPIRDQRAYLESVLGSVRQHAPADIAFEIIVVDDGSTEELQPVCDRFEARRLRLDPSQGPAHGRNAGATEAVGEILLFLDADVVCPAGFLDRVRKVFAADSETIGLSFINQAYDARDGVVKNYGAAIEHYWFTSYFNGNEPVARVRGFTTRNGAVRADAFRAIGGFDESFRTNAHEDYDFGKRLAARHKTVLSREPIVYHNFPDSLRRLIRNYWVRITLFVPYYVKYRPKLDKAQSSPAEAVLRLLGGSVPGWLILAALPIPGRLWWLAGAAGAFGLYAFSIRRFLGRAMAWSGGLRFPLFALGIHFITSQVVTVGGLWGLVGYLIGGGWRAGAHADGGGIA